MPVERGGTAGGGIDSTLCGILPQYGITDMPLAVYAGATFAFIIPGTALYAFGAAGVLDEANRALCLGVAAALLAAVVAAGVLLSRKAEYVEAAEAAGATMTAESAEAVEERG